MSGRRRAARSTSGTVADSAPGAPAGFTATAGDTEVALSWSAPTNTGGVAITHYQYRYVAGTTVPLSTDWREVPDSDNDGSRADERRVTVTGLVNGTQYAFEVRAVNSVGEGLEAVATATPAENSDQPNVVLELRAQTGDGAVTLEWGAPALSGSGGNIVRYEYRYAAGSAVPANSSWDSVEASRYPFVYFSGLENGRRYAFEVRAVNSNGFKGSAEKLTATPGVPVVQTLPSAPRRLSAAGSLYQRNVSELAQVELRWEAPAGSW